MKELLIITLIALYCHDGSGGKADEGYAILDPVELEELNQFPTTDSAVGYALMMYEGQE